LRRDILPARIAAHDRFLGTILLTAPSDKGVVWDPPLRNQTANRLLRQSADERRAGSA
jgi:hypothetical protein